MPASIDCLIVPAAGLGTRMKPVNPPENPNLPKELLPVGDQPAIHYAIAEGLDIGVNRIVVVLNRSKPELQAYLEGLDAPISIAYQESPTGEADAIATAENLAGTNAIAVAYPDNIYLPAPGAMRRLAAAFKQYGEDVVALARVTAANESTISHAGQVDLQPLDEHIYRIHQLGLKQPGHFKRRYPEELRTSGMMIVGPHLFDTIRKARPNVGEGEFTDEPIRRRLLQERGLLGVGLPGAMHDIGNPQGYAQCLACIEE